MKLIEGLKLLIVSFFTLYFLLSCSTKKSIVAQKVTYENWIGGQPGVGGTKYSFTVVGSSLEDVKLDSVYINNNKMSSFESNARGNSIIYTINIPDSFSQYGIGESRSNISSSNKLIPKSAYLFFTDSSKNVITLKFDDFIKKKTTFYK